MKPLLLDLFCGAGGALVGYARAGFHVVGVDNRPQPHYIGDHFICMDAFEAIEEFGHEADVIAASPPCQGYSRLRHLPWLKDKEYPLLIDATRAMLQALGKPYVIENVEDAPLLNGVTLCGYSLGMSIYRHRKFESSIMLMAPSHRKHDVIIGAGRMLNDRRKDSLNNSSAKGAWGNQTIVTVAGGQYRKADGERAMGIDWMTKDELSQAIPPRYTEYIGLQLMQFLQAKLAAKAA